MGRLATVGVSNNSSLVKKILIASFVGTKLWNVLRNEVLVGLTVVALTFCSGTSKFCPIYIRI